MATTHWLSVGTVWHHTSQGSVRSFSARLRYRPRSGVRIRDTLRTFRCQLDMRLHTKIPQHHALFLIVYHDSYRETACQDVGSRVVGRRVAMFPWHREGINAVRHRCCRASYISREHLKLSVGFFCAPCFRRQTSPCAPRFIVNMPCFLILIYAPIGGKGNENQSGSLSDAGLRRIYGIVKA